jgi:hypothetical protein
MMAWRAKGTGICIIYRAELRVRDAVATSVAMSNVNTNTLSLQHKHGAVEHEQEQWSMSRRMSRRASISGA